MKVLGWRAKYSWPAFLKALNFFRLPEKRSGIGTRGSGGGTIIVWEETGCPGRDGAETVLVDGGLGAAGAGEVVRCCSRPSSWKYPSCRRCTAWVRAVTCWHRATSGEAPLSASDMAGLYCQVYLIRGRGAERAPLAAQCGTPLEMVQRVWRSKWHGLPAAGR